MGRGDNNSSRTSLDSLFQHRAEETHNSSVEILDDGSQIETWANVKTGKTERIGGPAETTWYPNGDVLELWKKDGVIENGDDPAVVFRASDSGRPHGHISKYWAENGQIGRANQPALVRDLESGKRLEMWIRNGELDETANCGYPVRFSHADGRYVFAKKRGRVEVGEPLEKRTFYPEDGTPEEVHVRDGQLSQLRIGNFFGESISVTFRNFPSGGFKGRDISIVYDDTEKRLNRRFLTEFHHGAIVGVGLRGLTAFSLDANGRKLFDLTDSEDSFPEATDFKAEATDFETRASLDVKIVEKFKSYDVEMLDGTTVRWDIPDPWDVIPEENWPGILRLPDFVPQND